MPELDFALICDYVRVDNGRAHVISGGIDTIRAPSVPIGQNLGLLARFKFARNECERPHRVEVFFQDADGERLAEIGAAVTPEWQEDLPPAWKVGIGMAFNIGVPLPRHGEYAFEFLLNDSLVKTIQLRVIAPEGGAD